MRTGAGRMKGGGGRGGEERGGKGQGVREWVLVESKGEEDMEKRGMDKE